MREKFNDFTLFENNRKRRLQRQLTVVIGAIVLFYAFCNMINLWAVSDILVQESVFPLIWDDVMTVVNYIFYWTLFSYLLFVMFRFKPRDQVPFYIVLGIVVLLRYPLYFFASFFVGGFPTGELFLRKLIDELPYFGVNILFDLVIFGVYLGILKSIKKRLPRPRVRDARPPIFTYTPFDRLLSFCNSIQLGLLSGCGIICVLQLVSRLRYDIFYGNPSGFGDLLWMLFFYVTDLIWFFIGACVCVWLVNRLSVYEELAMLDFEELKQEDSI